MAGIAMADREDHLEFKSPNGKYRVVANWTGQGNSGYAWDVRNNKTQKSYFAEDKIQDNEALPHRFSAIWSPNGRYVAINLYYGRIAYCVTVIDTAGSEPREVSLFPKTVHKFDDYQTSAGPWLNNTDLEVEAYRPLYQGPHQEYDLVVRFGKNGGRIIKGD